MLLIGVKEENGWLLSRWNLTYRVGWELICKATHSVFEYYKNLEILVDDKPICILTKDDIFKMKEGSSLTIRGLSLILGVPIMITFFNQTNAVSINVASTTEEFKIADYQKFNLSLGQYVDSIELSMYR
ncbi:hypothetical protein [Clostridium paraputrificum]|uniref:Uncharacterized protein n=1 Tax=Clostridium paraputrificum TaxID=29363 RepID=A0A6N3CI26_9CLOT